MQSLLRSAKLLVPRVFMLCVPISEITITDIFLLVLFSLRLVLASKVVNYSGVWASCISG